MFPRVRRTRLRWANYIDDTDVQLRPQALSLLNSTPRKLPPVDALKIISRTLSSGDVPPHLPAFLGDIRHLGISSDQCDQRGRTRPEAGAIRSWVDDRVSYLVEVTGSSLAVINCSTSLSEELRAWYSNRCHQPVLTRRVPNLRQLTVIVGWSTMRGLCRSVDNPNFLAHGVRADSGLAFSLGDRPLLRSVRIGLTLQRLPDQLTPGSYMTWANQHFCEPCIRMLLGVRPRVLTGIRFDIQIGGIPCRNFDGLGRPCTWKAPCPRASGHISPGDRGRTRWLTFDNHGATTKWAQTAHPDGGALAVRLGLIHGTGAGVICCGHKLEKGDIVTSVEFKADGSFTNLLQAKLLYIFKL